MSYPGSDAPAWEPVGITYCSQILVFIVCFERVNSGSDAPASEPV